MPALTATQIDPRTGKQQSLGAVEGRFQYTPPDKQDWVVYIGTSPAVLPK
jgi:hypothetical protein